MSKHYTLIVCTEDGTYVGTAHYASKAAMVSDLRIYIDRSYQVEAMTYEVWQRRREES